MKLNLDPLLGKDIDKYHLFCSRLNKLINEDDDQKYIRSILQLKKEIKDSCAKNNSLQNLKLSIANNITLDLSLQGWELNIENNKIVLTSKKPSENATEEKMNIRRKYLVGRAQQFLDKNVKEFITKMERNRNSSTGWHSIFSLMRDGKDLADKLIETNSILDDKEKLKYLSKIISPYIQFAEPNKKCEITGLSLLDIWRYFRYTWLNANYSIPGRAIAILIRDSSLPNHPVIGIGALGSSASQNSIRDRWIGWESDTFVKNIVDNPVKSHMTYLVRQLEKLIKDIYKKDLMRLKIISPEDLTNPSKIIIQRLKDVSDKAIKLHRLFPDSELSNQLKNKKSYKNKDWEKIAESNLYKSKRCRNLSSLLKIKNIFQSNGLYDSNKGKLAAALKVVSFRTAVGQLARKIKAENVGVNMMDIVTCGAIAPYNAILGGKLVCSLLTSPEIIKYYKKKYNQSDSIIASAMQGKKVIKNQDLVYLGTTSLFTVGSSQYNRIKIPAKELGSIKNEFLEYKKLGLSEGFGSFHISKDTIRLIHDFLGRRQDGRRVNSIFGEGANPLMRKIREALDLIGLPSQEILHHGVNRVIYGIPLASNYQDVLLGISKKPKYIIPTSKPIERTELIADFWRKRWLNKRILNDDIIKEVEKHTTSYPVNHGARVKYVLLNEEEDLFP